MMDMLFDGFWTLGIVMAIHGLRCAAKYEWSEWPYWGWVLVFATGSSMMMHWVRALTDQAPR